MRLGKRAAGALGGVLVLLLITGCTRDAAGEPVPPNATAGPQTAGDNVTLTPEPFPAGAGTIAVGNPSPAGPTAIPAPVSDSPVATAIPAPTQALPATATPTPTTPPVPGSETSYTVQAGDRLFSIGRKFGVNPYSIAQVNNILPPYIIRPGQVLRIPSGGGTVTPVPGGKLHVVAPGENLFRIALRYGTTVQAVAAANNIINVNLIFVGQTLRIP